MNNSSETEKTKTLFDLIEVVLADDRLTKYDKLDFIGELRKNDDAVSERAAYRWTVVTMGATLFVAVIAIVLLIGTARQVPGFLIAITCMVGGGLLGLVAPPGKRKVAK